VRCKMDDAVFRKVRFQDFFSVGIEVKRLKRYAFRG
jgi:hypothetical protein